jgi:hypothetical protein
VKVNKAFPSATVFLDASIAAAGTDTYAMTAEIKACEKNSAGTLNCYGPGTHKLLDATIDFSSVSCGSPSKPGTHCSGGLSVSWCSGVMASARDASRIRHAPALTLPAAASRCCRP